MNLALRAVAGMRSAWMTSVTRSFCYVTDLYDTGFDAASSRSPAPVPGLFGAFGVQVRDGLKPISGQDGRDRPEQDVQ